MTLTYAILIFLFIILAIILFSVVIAINRIVIRHGDEVFSNKTENGKLYRKKIFKQVGEILCDPPCLPVFRGSFSLTPDYRLPTPDSRLIPNPSPPYIPSQWE
jgi:hypothetical protein